MSASKSSREKGDVLEAAVAGIEAAFIHYDPSLKGSNYRIERKKRVTVDGVLHELDVFVSFDFGPHHSTSFIFECKNWSAKVDKNEVIVLSEKVRAVGAQQGFLVARAFSACASAQSAKEDSRVKLLPALDLLAGDAPMKWPGMRKCGPEDIQYAFNLIADDDASSSPEFISLPPELSEKFKGACQMVLQADCDALKAVNFVGREVRRVKHSAPFGPVQLNGRLIRRIDFFVNYTFVNEEIPVEVVARFDIPGYGRHLALNFDHPQRGSLRLELSAPETRRQPESNSQSV